MTRLYKRKLKSVQIIFQTPCNVLFMCKSFASFLLQHDFSYSYAEVPCDVNQTQFFHFTETTQVTVLEIICQEGRNEHDNKGCGFHA